MSFYIEKIIVTGSGKTDSIIELSNGVNIIYGPSNTGKTYIVKCIDYMFGSEREPIDISTGYQYIKIIVRTQCGTITMSRKIGENKIEVSSNDNNVPSGKYATKASRTNYDKTINSVWLSLIGINDLHLVISNENYKKQILSWRTFSHMFMLTETKIIPFIKNLAKYNKIKIVGLMTVVYSFDDDVLTDYFNTMKDSCNCILNFSFIWSRFCRDRD